jgi:mannosyltransferase
LTDFQARLKNVAESIRRTSRPGRARRVDYGIIASVLPVRTQSLPTAEDPSPRTTRWVRPATVVVVVAAVALRFLTRSPMWLDEAQTVNIASRSVPDLFTALRHDGSPPLYYVVLHMWMVVFGTSNFSARALSGVFSVASLPLMAVAARRFGLAGRSPWPAVLLLATCPFAVRYATEARMYSLLLLLVLLALLAYERVWSVGGPWPVAGASLVTGALVLTHYWSLFLVATAFVAAAFFAWRGDRPARRVLLPMVIGCLFFLPWLPSFAYQSAHTAAPWGGPPGIDTPVLAFSSWVGSGFTAPLLTAAYYTLVVLALAGTAVAAGGITIARPLRRTPLLLLGLGVGTLLLGTVASEVVSSAYSSRYSAVAVAPLLLVVAIGIGALPERRRIVAVAIVCGLGLFSSALIPDQLRSQSADVATALAAAGPQDLVVFCPDQLGPAVHRTAPDAGRQVVYPTFGSPAMVDWVDYAKRNHAADPLAFARQALARAGGHTIWLVYAQGYRTLAGACTSLYTSFAVARGRPVVALKSKSTSFEQDSVAKFAAR